MAPKIVDKDQRKHEIAVAALDIFAERGFETTSISQIAEAVGVSKGTIYLYFNSKVELTVAAAHAWVAAIEDEVAPLLDRSQDPLTQLRMLIHASTDAFLRDPRMISLFIGIVQVALRDPDLLERLDVIRKVSAPIRNAICEIIRGGVSNGFFDPEASDRAEDIAINLVAYIDGIGMHYVANPGFFDLSSQIDLYIDGLLDSLRASSVPVPKEKGND